jgi:phosphopantothenoylcysteine synthetase/decarboxylase
VHEAVRDCDVLVMSAAVSDYKPARVAKAKIKKRDENFSLDMTPDARHF